MRDTRRSSKPEYRARYPDARPISQANPVCRQRPRTAEVMVGRRVRCAWGYFCDAKSRCRRGLHRPGCGGSTPPSRSQSVPRWRDRDWVASIAAMQRSLKPQSTGQHRGDPPFHAGVAQQRQQQFRKLPGDSPHGSASLPVGPISCSRSSNYQSGRLRTARLQVRFLPGVPFCRVSPTTRGTPLRTERLGVEIPHAAPIWPT